MIRRSLIGRLLLLTIAVAVISTAATAWLVMTSTTAAIRQQQGQSLTQDAQIYRRLIQYAAHHRSWSGVRPTLIALSRQTGRVVTLTTAARRPLASSSADGQLAATPTARVDALTVDQTLQTTPGHDGISPGVLGPYRTPVTRTSPAPVAVAAPVDAVADARDRRALSQLAALVNRCLPRSQRISSQRLSAGGWYPPAQIPSASALLRRCYAQARIAQLRPYVASPALLYVGGAGGSAAAALDLSGPHRRRIVEVVLLILLGTVGFTALAARRLIRPLRTLTSAAEKMSDGELHTRVRITGDDEVARLGRAFNEMAARRHALEAHRSALVSDVAHELRTPVSNIRGWLEAAEDGIAEMDPALVTSLIEEADQLIHLITDLTDLAAAEAGELKLHPEPIDLRDVVDHVAAIHRLAAERDGVRIVAEATGALDADPVRVRQLLSNLVSNAVRHSPPGATVTIRSADCGDHIGISVVDTGPGIPSADLTRVFERFWRADKSRARATGGSGLGLAVVRRLAEAHGGSVSVTSTVGVGSTFTVLLPLRVGDPQVMAVADSQTR